MEEKINIMKELLDRYEQLQFIKHSPMAKEELEFYISTLEKKLKELL